MPTYSMRELLELRLAGKPLPEVVASPRSPRERSYKCLRCFDDGRVICVHPETIREADMQIKEHGEWNGKPLLTMAAACSCDLGETYHIRQDKKGRNSVFLVRFSIDTCLPVESGWKRPDWVKRVTAFVAHLEKRRLAQMESEPHGYNRDLGF